MSNQNTSEKYETWSIKSSAIFGSGTKSLVAKIINVHFSQII
jgi:hypothetical protein